ncbi:MAG: RNA methyltransferase [Neisseria sp.]|nr:RNA methyltransferase [Neisseria sp.]
MKTITSAQNDALKHLAKLLSSAKYRRETGQAALEGVHLLDALLNAGGMPVQVFVPEHRSAAAEVQALLARVPQETVYTVAERALEKINSLSEGADIVSVMVVPSEKALPENGDCAVLEKVQDPGNIGTVLRSAAASGVQRIVLDKGCADVWSPKVLRAGMGAHFLLSLHTRADLLQWRPAYREPLYVTALGAGKPKSLYELDLRGPCAWLFGNEGSGASETMQQAADECVLIPMAGATESLNVAMAATVCLFEQMRQRLP